MANAALLVMAAGLGTRYGGDKQIDRFGKDGKLLMQYSIDNALREGFDKVVFVIRREHRDIIERLCGSALREDCTAGTPPEVCYAYQDYASLPAFYRVPAGRTKPFGTVHAVLCARDVIRERFAVMNADDYYGPDVFRVLRGEIGELRDGSMAGMAAYRLANTLSLHGAVTRGKCIVKDGHLQSVSETYGITVTSDGVITDENGGRLDPDTAASMNVWAFHPGMFGLMERRFEAFLRALPEGELKKEYALPTMVGEMLGAGEISVLARPTDARWFGVTYREDKPLAEAEIAALEAGR